MEERAALLKSVSAPATSSARKSPASSRPSHDSDSSSHDALREKVYVLDTNVLIHDPNSLLNFEEHRVVIPMTVLEEIGRASCRERGEIAAGGGSVRGRGATGKRSGGRGPSA